MRSDMAKVIVERPRTCWGGPGKGYRRSLQRLGVEDLPKREGIKRRCSGGSKAFSDLLGPLERYLRKQVGRPWDKVYSEICAELPGRFPVREHFLRHVFQVVVKDVVLIDGVACWGDGWGYGRPLSQHLTFPTNRGRSGEVV